MAATMACSMVISTSFALARNGVACGQMKPRMVSLCASRRLVGQRYGMTSTVPPSRYTSLSIRASDAATAEPATVPPIPAISLSEKAVSHLKRLKGDKDALYLRVGVRQGGCSGMSYVMDFEDDSKVRPEDSKIEADGITLICDPKSLLFLFGMQLDYSDALIGGGFSFSNPNATSTCGCGKSFAA